MPWSLKHGNQRHCTDHYYFRVAGKAQFFSQPAHSKHANAAFSIGNGPHRRAIVVAPDSAKNSHAKILWCPVYTHFVLSNGDSLAFLGNRRNQPKSSRHLRDLKIERIFSEGLYTHKNPRTPPKKSKDFFEDLKSVYFIREWTTPLIQCLNRLIFIKSS